jgi:hypothetical protein
LNILIDACSPAGDSEPGTRPAPKSALEIESHLKIVYNWTAPEVLAGHPFTVSSDIYSLCAVMWEAINGTQCIITKELNFENLLFYFCQLLES